MKKVILTFEYEENCYYYEDGEIIPSDIETWEETFYQSDAVIGDLKMTGVKVVDTSKEI